ncbi:thiamine biosynthesis protein ThiI [Desulfotomaculum arcticum]|uniref:Probable tRNA sulfurtransferase n=1 Tax=Desulfotruncus arcticus DSM 17038 TaxID=1121424 RepID=A0A1I2TC57_9FIRM|nr:tRNA uracil 4-sulfurtransferase ThiI [Desulfotruncus arcticus]SFG62465.1 thiamine biosynthesis protein ThiI [Desulfotomaculum arcticum] [Desulfotruncus arcticus DSM 17038]
MYNTYLIRYGEIGLKGKNRPQFERRLMENMRRALSKTGSSRVERVYGRLVVESDAEPAQVLDRLSKVFGIVGVSPTLRLPLDMQAVSDGALQTLKDAAALVQLPPGASLTFKVEARRSNKMFPLTSPEINGQIGGYLLENIPGLQVDVHKPIIKVNVEIREKNTFVYAADVPGAGGLPVGASGKALLLLSGGIDSPVAGWMAMKRGIEIEAIHFYSFPFTGEKSLEKVRDLCRILANYTARIKLHVVHFTDIQKEIQKNCPEELRVTLMRRMMFRLSERIAGQQGALALVTGESVGQVASQTLESMQVINHVINIPVLRPLVGMDKVEIITRAQAIGTFETSVLPYEDCCTLFLPKHPATRPRLEQAEQAEQALNIEELLAGALDRTIVEIIKS